MLIIACCASCKKVYELTRRSVCPDCGLPGLLWASRLDGSEEEDPEEPEVPWPHVLNREGTRCRPDCLACAWLRRDKPEVQWLDKLYELEDLR